VDENQFETDVLKIFFKTAKLSSFKRQLNIYGFTRVVDGPSKEAYTHDGFVIGDWDHIATHVFRKKKAKKPEEPKVPPEVPDFTRTLEIEGGCETGFRANDEGDIYANGKFVGCGNKSITTRELLEEIRRPAMRKERTWAELEAGHKGQTVPALTLMHGINGLMHVADPVGVVSSQTPLPQKRARNPTAECSMEPSSKRAALGKPEPLFVPDDAILEGGESGPTPSTPTMEPVKRTYSFNMEMGALDRQDSFGSLFGDAASNDSQLPTVGRTSSIGDDLVDFILGTELPKVERKNSLAMDHKKNSLYSKELDAFMEHDGDDDEVIMGTESTNFAAMQPRPSCLSYPPRRNLSFSRVSCCFPQ